MSLAGCGPTAWPPGAFERLKRWAAARKGRYQVLIGRVAIGAL